MGITTDQYKMLIRFLDAEMDTAEMVAFEKELASNPDLREQLDFEQLLRNTFSAQNIQKIPTGEVTDGDSLMSKSYRKGKPIRKLLAFCAAAVIATLIFILFIWKKQEIEPSVTKIPDNPSLQKKDPAIVPEPMKDSNEIADLSQLYNHYYKKDPIPEEYPFYLAEALTDYEKGKFSTLKNLNLTDLPSTRSRNPSSDKQNILKWGHYYKGLAFLQTGNDEDAIINLDWVVKKQTGKALQARAEWYMTLAYLRLRDKSKAVELCKNIISNNVNDSLVKKAKEILNLMEK